MAQIRFRRSRRRSHAAARRGLAVRASEQNFRLIVDSVAGMMCTTTASGELEFVNRQLLEYFGRSLEELRGWQRGDTVHPDDLERVIDAWRQGMATGQPYGFEPRLRRADGVYRWFQFRNAPQRDADGRLIRWYGLYVDVDDLKRAQDLARARERELRLLIDSIPAFLFTMTPACELEQVNRQGLDYFGKTLEELQQWDRIGCVHPDDLPRVRESLQRTIDFGEPHEVEQRLRGADGVYRWFQPRGMALRDAQGRIIRWYCFLSDIDDLRNAEEALRSTQSRLSRATQLATVSELSACIAHEVNQPLTAVIANGHACRRWLSAQPANVAKAMLSADRIVRNGNAAAEVVQRIRSLFQRAPPIKDELSMNDVLTEVCELMADEFRTNGVALVTSLQADLPRAAADRVQMQQVVFNLVRNGIEAAADVAGPRQLSIHSQSQGEEILVHVTDTGAGIGNPEAIFEPFYTTKPSGMGMGLAVCRSIIEAHGGRLWAAPSPPAGSTFSFALHSVAREAR